jgi:hypothetical protein
MKSRIRIWALLSLVLGFATGCACSPSLPPYDLPTRVEDPDSVDKSLLTGEPCAPPCWYGLVPGESSADEVLSTLRSLPFVDPDSIDEDFISWESSVSRAGYSIGRIRIEEGKIRAIDIDLEYDLTLQELIDVLGEPAGYEMIAHPSQPDGFGPTCYTHRVIFIWPENGLSAELIFYLPELVSEGEPILSPDLYYIRRVSYRVPGSTPQDFIEANGVSAADARERIECCYHEWQGIDNVTMP